MSPVDAAPPATALDPEREARLALTWATPPGLWGWLTTVDPKEIGKRYVATGLVFFVLGGLLALLMRTQLARPESGLISPDRYNQIFSMHGTTMMFLFAVPIMEAMAVYLVPLVVGARTMAFPRLNAFSYWVYLAGGVMIYVAFLLNIAPEAGWTGYTPLSGPEYSPGKRTDIWAQMVTFTEVAALAAAASTATTILKLRAPGMTLARMPLFAWAMLVTAFMIMLAMPAVMLATSFLISDRLVGTHFFNAPEGGDNLLYQHLFWFFGHPEVYIIFLPGLGMVSEITQTFSRRTTFGYPLLVLALLAIGFLAFGLWVHHMFTTGLPHMGNSFYTAASMTIALPSGIQIFCWIATMWDGKPRFQTPLLFVVGFIITFVLGGLSGVMLASVPLDTQVHDTYFVVAHFHYVLIGGAVFPLLGGIFYWFPKVFGRMPNETAGKWSFWLIFLGFHVAFFPMHLLGLWGMPRRVYTYPSEMGWADMNLLSTAGSLVLATGVGVYLLNLAISWRRGRPAGPNPWQAGGLEWATSSPPPPHNFGYTPFVEGRQPLWTSGPHLPLMDGLSLDHREVLLTTVSDAAPDVREGSPGPTLWPLLTGLATTALFVGSIFNEWLIVWLSIPVTLCVVGWFWPKPSHTSKVGAPERTPPGALA
ncbi:cytochrome c oxidase subunit I [Phenylobacterium deserti]|uniref:Cytochrome c oxidase subunit 1 n=1 Tax=Phenylobacterium deserti TaxID=1914756 RepID=A0A328AQR3_9CAUL|nr:cytochrome c oxidase subunit I [Phenylobacterium deserti]RAK56919.1 cytochrome c oxidase subunit I [Phenylobacterium deserti]